MSAQAQLKQQAEADISQRCQLIPSKLLEIDQLPPQFEQLYDRQQKKYQFMRNMNNASELSSNSHQQAVSSDQRENYHLPANSNSVIAKKDIIIKKKRSTQSQQKQSNQQLIQQCYLFSQPTQQILSNISKDNIIIKKQLTQI